MVTIRDNIGLDERPRAPRPARSASPQWPRVVRHVRHRELVRQSIARRRAQNWRLRRPVHLLPLRRGEFCCDQLVLWEPKRKFWVWLLQYSQLGGTNISGSR